MKTYDLDIQKVENKLIITIDKSKLDANYILYLMNLLHHEAFLSDNIHDYQKDNADESITTHTNKEQIRKWEFAASVDLKNKLEGVNLRDFAYE